jgi:serine/threonine-protein kinase
VSERVGRRFSHYRVLERLGAGGMGVVYRAHDERLQRDVALKLLSREAVGDQRARERLVAEARKAAGLNHPNVCTIHEVGEAEGQTYFAMEWVRGQPLGGRIPAGGLAVETAVAYAVQIAEALAHAHERGLVHRDLKGDNVVITPEGRVKVLDFGIARRVAAGGPGSLGTGGPRVVSGQAATATTVVAGTPHYLPPEVLHGEPADASGDIWALGVLLHEMLAGERPFRGQTEFEIAASVLNAEPAALPASVPEALRGLVRRCLAKDPAARYQSAREVRAVLEMVGLGEKGAARRVGKTAPEVGARPTGARPWMPLLAAVLLLATAALGWRLLASRGGRSPAVGGAAIRSLAVLPLENLSRDPEQEYFADGMTEELITNLANLEGVSVISGTSAMRYKGTKKSIPEIARELGVEGVVEGSALRAGDRVRITAQLIDAAHDRHVWARSYERDLEEVLALQAEVAAAIAGEIRAALSTRGRIRAMRAPAVDPQAYEDYLKGRSHWAQRGPEPLRRAEEFFRRAIAQDPGYAPAHAGLADVYAVISPYARIPSAETFPKAREAVLKALELDDQLAEAHATLGLVRWQYDYDWPGAAAAFRRALTLNPSYATAHQWYGGYLAFMGKPLEGLAELDRARELDPLSPVIRRNRGDVLIALRRYDDAAAAAREALELDPDEPGAHGQLGHIHLARKDEEGLCARAGRVRPVRPRSLRRHPWRLRGSGGAVAWRRAGVLEPAPPAGEGARGAQQRAALRVHGVLRPARPARQRLGLDRSRLRGTRRDDVLPTPLLRARSDPFRPPLRGDPEEVRARAVTSGAERG